MQKRYIEAAMRADLEHKKMVFLAGPRQVGKTTFFFCRSQETYPFHTTVSAAYLSFFLPGYYSPPSALALWRIS